MTCSHCEKSVEKGVGEIAGVSGVKAHASSNSVDVFYKGDMPDLASVKKKIVDLGFDVVA